MKTTQLPKAAKDICHIIEEHVRREETKNSIRRTKWLLALAYQQGYRRFDVFDPYNARIQSYYLEKDGKLPMQIPEMQKAINDVQGIMATMDLRPVAKRQGNSLSAIRQRSIAQVIADAHIDEDQLTQVQTDYVNMVATLGTAGIQAEIVDDSMVGLTAELEVIHPRELYPFPSVGWNRSAQEGIIRQRWFSLAYLKEKYGAKILKHLDEMTTMERKAGQAVEDPMMTMPPVELMGVAPTMMSDESFVAVKVKEVYIYGPRRTCVRYMCMSGEYMFADIDLSGQQSYCPIAKGIFWDVGDFYGAGLYDILFSMIREFEKMIKDLVNNVRDLGRYPITILPQGAINEHVAFRDTGYDMKYLTAAIDPQYGGDSAFRPITISPHNAGDLPGRTAQFMKEMIAQVSPIQNLIKEKGRGDSLPFMQFLDDENKRPITVPVKSMVETFSSVYRYVVSKATLEMMKSPRALPLTNLDIGLLGAVIDWDQGTVSFAKNPLPDMSRLSFTVKEASPRREALRKQEALMLFKDVHQDITRLMMLASEEGLDFAMWSKAEDAAHLVVMMNCLQLFNDGVNPGGFWMTPYTEAPEIQLRFLKAVLGGPELRVASKKVVDGFIKYQKVLTAYTGAVLPPQVPDPYTDPMIAAMQQRMLQGGGQPGMMMQPQLQA